MASAFTFAQETIATFVVEAAVVTVTDSWYCVVVEHRCFVQNTKYDIILDRSTIGSNTCHSICQTWFLSRRRLWCRLTVLAANRVTATTAASTTNVAIVSWANVNALAIATGNRSQHANLVCTKNNLLVTHAFLSQITKLANYIIIF